MIAAPRWLEVYSQARREPRWFFVMGQVGPRRKFFRESLRAVGLVSGLGLELGLTTVGGALLGHYLDERWRTGGPWLTLAGMFCGLGAGLSGVVAIIRRVGED